MQQEAAKARPMTRLAYTAIAFEVVTLELVLQRVVEMLRRIPGPQGWREGAWPVRVVEA